VRDPRRSLSLLTLCLTLVLPLTAAPGRAQCVGDCAQSGQVTISNLILGVSISLGRQTLSSCEAFDENGDGTVSVSELIRAVNNALNGCPPEPTASPTPQATPTVGGGVAASGDELTVNSTAAGDQSSPAAAAGDGQFLVSWQSRGEDGDDYGVVGRRLGAGGAPVGEAALVNQTQTSAQRAPAVAATADAFVVAWSSYGQDGNGDGIFARRLGADGAPLGSEFAVNQFSSRDQSYPAVAAQGSGAFLVVWESTGQDTNGRGVFGRRFNSSGAAIGSEFQVPDDGGGDERRPAVAALADGAFAVAWMSDRADGDGRGIVARRVAADGSPAGSEFVVNNVSAGDQAYPAVAAVDSEHFVVAWESDGEDGDGRSIVARYFTNAGAAVGEAFAVNRNTTGNQRRPKVASDGDGGFVATWETPAEVGVAVVGQRFDSRARARGSEFPVPSRGELAARRPVVAGGGTGFVVVWENYPDGDGDGYGIASRRFDLLP